MHATNFSALDALIVVAFLVGTTAAGVATHRFVRNVEGFFVAERRVGGYLGVASIIATELGLVTVMLRRRRGSRAGSLRSTSRCWPRSRRSWSG